MVISLDLAESNRHVFWFSLALDMATRLISARDQKYTRGCAGYLVRLAAAFRAGSHYQSLRMSHGFGAIMPLPVGAPAHTVTSTRYRSIRQPFRNAPGLRVVKLMGLLSCRPFIETLFGQDCGQVIDVQAIAHARSSWTVDWCDTPIAVVVSGRRAM
jgi:hypothetical protein